MSASDLTANDPSYPDVFSEGVSECSLDDRQKLALLTDKWDNVHSFTFPSRYNGGKMRKAQAGWFTSTTWLRYSVSTDGVYCASCFLFGEKDPRCKALTKYAVTGWSNIKKIIEKHGDSEYHAQQSIAAQNFKSIMQGDTKDIECSINSQYNSLVEVNRQILVGIVETIILCGQQNLAIRGKEEESSNFKALLNFQAKHNVVLKEHLLNGDPRTKYTSPKIQNELINICGKLVSDEIVQACNKSEMFGFIADEATDSATKEQMALCVRFVDTESNTVQEDFIGFAECESTTGESLANSFLENLRNLGVIVENMRGQGYDGAGNMSGKHRGVQARIRTLIPEAIYTHCRAHCLNLAIVHASREHYARNMMSTVQVIAFAFNYSAKRLLNFQDNLENDPVSREEMEKRTKLQSLCETRWAARADALHTFLCAYRTVVTSLEQLSADGDAKASSYLLSVLQFDFIVTLVAIEHVLASLVPLSKLLQGKSCDLIRAATETRVVKALIQNERADDNVWDALYQKAVDLASVVDVVPSTPRNVGCQRNRPNVRAQNVSDFWKNNMYLPFVDHLLTELDDRLLQGNDRYNAECLIPAQVKRSNLPEDSCKAIYAGFRSCLTADEPTFLRECAKWRTWWTSEALAADRPDPAKTLEGSIAYASEELYPNIRKCFMLLLVMPVSTATAERSFSTMRRVKTYLRSTMGTERLSGLGLLNIYSERAINAEHVVDIFAQKKPRKLALLFRV